MLNFTVVVLFTALADEFNLSTNGSTTSTTCPVPLPPGIFIPEVIVVPSFLFGDVF